MSGPSRRDLSIALPSFASLAVVGLAYWNFIQSHYYIAGPSYFDTGYLSYLVSQGSPWLENPPIVRAVFGFPSWFTTHVTPLLILYTLLMKALMVSPANAFALLYVLSLGLSAAVASFLAAKLLPRSRAKTRALLAIAFGLSLAFSGIAMMIAAAPHFEVLFVPLAAMSLYLILNHRTTPAWVALACCLALRETRAFTSPVS